MRPGRLLRALATMIVTLGATMALPAIAALVWESPTTDLAGYPVPIDFLVFLAAGLSTTSVGLGILLATRAYARQDLRNEEGYAVVALGWIVIPAAAAIPFWTSGTLGALDSFFEAVSGFTTTGATVIASPASLPASIQLWRAMLQFMGGLAIVVMASAVLSRIGPIGLHALMTQAPGTSSTRMRPRIRNAMQSFGAVYGIVAAAMFVAFTIGFLVERNVTVSTAIYDGALYAMTTVSTGGFSHHDGGLASITSPALQAMFVAAMIVAAGSMGLYHMAWRDKWRVIVKDPEWRMFILVILAGSIAVAALLLIRGDGWASTWGGVTATISVGTGTGHRMTGAAAAPGSIRLILLLLMITGGMAGSTTGGIRALRALILGRIVGREVRKLLHPRAVILLRLRGKSVSDDAVMGVIAFFFAYITAWIFGAMALIVLEPSFDMLGGAEAAAASLGNVGPAAHAVGGTGAYSTVSGGAKAVMMGLMWLGRMELFTALLVFNRQTWSR